eukprot:UN14340
MCVFAYHSVKLLLHSYHFYRFVLIKFMFELYYQPSRNNPPLGKAVRRSREFFYTHFIQKMKT